MSKSAMEDELKDISLIIQEHDDKIDRMMQVINYSCGRLEAVISLLAQKYEDFELNLELTTRGMLEEREREYAQWRKTCDSEVMEADNSE